MLMRVTIQTDVLVNVNSCQNEEDAKQKAIEAVRSNCFEIVRQDIGNSMLPDVSVNVELVRSFSEFEENQIPWSDDTEANHRDVKVVNGIQCIDTDEDTDDLRTCKQVLGRK